MTDIGIDGGGEGSLLTAADLSGESVTQGNAQSMLEVRNTEQHLLDI